MTSDFEPDGIHNFRSLSGYATVSGKCIRSGRIYRSGALELMTTRDAEHLGAALGVKTVLDLRHPDEFAPGMSPHALAERVHLLSIFPEAQKQADLIAELNGLYGPGPSPQRYMHYLEVGGDRLSQAFELFAEDQRYPFLVHCTAGKDRTGVLLGMIMDVAGCTPDDIAQEYGLSDASIERLIEYLRSTGRALEGTDDEIRARLSTPPERMAGFIELLHQKYGSSADFFMSQGVKQETVEKVRDLVTE